MWTAVGGVFAVACEGLASRPGGRRVGLGCRFVRCDQRSAWVEDIDFRSPSSPRRAQVALLDELTDGQRRPVTSDVRTCWTTNRENTFSSSCGGERCSLGRAGRRSCRRVPRVPGSACSAVRARRSRRSRPVQASGCAFARLRSLGGIDVPSTNVRPSRRGCETPDPLPYPARWMADEHVGVAAACRLGARVLSPGPADVVLAYDCQVFGRAARHAARFISVTSVLSGDRWSSPFDEISTNCVRIVMTECALCFRNIYSTFSPFCQGFYGDLPLI